MLSSFNFSQSLKKLLPQAQQKTFLLAASGGVDSMVLLDLCHQLQLNFEVAHVNYHLRNEDSKLDMQLVENWCSEKKIKFHLYEVSQKDNQPKNSIENWARDIRYRFFNKILIKNNIDFVITAHHLNDRLETFIINLSKASGLKGLKSIPEKTEKILRPLLDFSRQEIEDYAKQHQIIFREDYTNAENIYVRNKIRNQITPLLKELNKDFLENFKTSLEIIKDSKNFIDQQIDLVLETIKIPHDELLILNQTELALQTDFVKYEILNRFGMTSSTEIKKLITAEKGKIFFTHSHQFSVGRQEILVQELKEEIEVVEEFILETTIVSDAEILVSVPENFKNPFWEFDAEKIVLPLKLRPLKIGDVFSPKGMKGKKKVSKFLRDEKLSISDAAAVRVLVDAEDQILGVFPLRQSQHFIISDKTNQTLKLI
ncbi:tRNA lysidine(34) synthetase TilS [Chryseobacterium sp. POL2]|uniref:tRNA lysidine(34) synthetase TilS n=1 Tax=Chryseobacterium sp. POL2 TaxID=2713414 RepID=UPI0013E0FEC8|nr:tRNA lysidine(34) synthetase TilS [Chryseobacterium sp. POL2]QIG88334.1 tRNA lysidine(34) synthetase TilS [Chryseobacterium sp. POL2]